MSGNRRTGGGSIGRAGSAAIKPNGCGDNYQARGMRPRDGCQTIQIGFMSANEDINKFENELEQERHELRDTVNQIDRKIRRARDWVDPARFVRRHPFALMSAAVCLGFLVGTHPRLERLVWGRGN
jgi:hypothetical protein